ncbi:hypothetical protein [Nocardia africana]|uniref:Uncharacterized protein n=1 Tax=Nocardia africana TaxID=134964 RepID=A0A378WYC4_9NOCA|nr:hypothetical protein [Nocardia africana]MCC3312491.1 hypothetical protein [Nocardia africana]SUA46189.1 Uncharacterised protein [Nocardia africana]
MSVPTTLAARAILSGLADGREEIFPDPMSASIAAGWDDGVVKSLERANAASVQAVAVAS